MIKSRSVCISKTFCWFYKAKTNFIGENQKTELETMDLLLRAGSFGLREDQKEKVINQIS